MAILHPSVFYALWGGHCETLLSLNVLHVKGEYRQRSKHISKFFYRNSTLHIIAAICRFNKKVKECKAWIRKGHNEAITIWLIFKVRCSKIMCVKSQCFFKSYLKKVSFFNIFYIINTVWKQFTSKGRMWQRGIHFGKILFSGRFDSWLTQPFLPFRSVWCLDWWKSTFCEPLMGHVGPPEKPNVKLRPKLTTCMEALLALTCFSTTPSYKTVMVKLILLQIFSSTFFKCSSIFDTTSIISWMSE